MNTRPHLLLDAAKMDGYIFLAKEMNERHRCLYEGDSEKFLGSVAPWLFSIDMGSEFTDWVSELGSAESWGVLLLSSAEEEEVYRHLRKFLIVDTEEGKELYFRYYDPRVLRVFLPTCDTEQLIEFFGPIEAFVVEDEEGMMVEYSLDGHALRSIPLEQDLSTTLKTPISPTEAQESPNIDSTPKTVTPDSHRDPDSRWDFGF